MKPAHSYLKINIIGQLILIVVLLFFLLNETYAKADVKHSIACNSHIGKLNATFILANKIA